MIIQYPITGVGWTPITSAGESGTCWLDEQDDGAAGQVDVRIWHGTTAPSGTDTTKAKRCYKPMGNDDIMLISADGGEDIYYATCANANGAATLSVDI